VVDSEKVRCFVRPTRLCKVLSGSQLREPPRRTPSWRNPDANKHCTKGGALKDTLILLNLQSGAVRLSFDAQESCSSNGEPGAKEDLVAVFLQRGFRGRIRHFAEVTEKLGNRGQRDAMRCGLQAEGRL
jgi:hypothetical protein